MFTKNERKQPGSVLLTNLASLAIVALVAVVFVACNSSSGNPNTMAQPPQMLPVLIVQNTPATTFQEYPASIEGSKDIEIRPQVDGYLERIYVDEGAQVRKGQVLFQINNRPYLEQLNNALASLSAAKANLANAEINVAKLTPLVQNNVISDVQLKTAKTAYDAAQANVAQAQAMVSNARINLGYTQIKAPVDGYIGRLPHKTGSLVGTSTAAPLTILSEIKEVYAYFSLSENDFLRFKDQFEGRTMEEKLKKMPTVELVLSNDSVYAHKGKVEAISGQFNQDMGAISFRASFKNTDGLLRSGNTGRIRIPRLINGSVVVPQEATFELQDKVFVFAVSDSNKVSSVPIAISGKSGNYYLVDKGIKAGDKIIFSGLDRLQEGALITPQPLSLDSLLKAKPL